MKRVVRKRVFFAVLGCLVASAAWMPGARETLVSLFVAVAGSQAERLPDSDAPVSNPRAHASADAGADADAASVRDGDSQEHGARRPAARLPVAGVVVQRQPFVLSVQGTGRAQSLRRAELSMPVGERVAAVHVRPGDHVQRGQPLLELEQRSFEIAVEEARARHAKAQVDYDVQLLGDAEVPDDKRLRVAHRTGVTEAAQQMERAQRDLLATILHAPFEGFVVDVRAVVGEQLQQGVTVVTIVDLGRLRLPAEVLENDFGRLRPGAAAHIRFPAIPEAEFDGRIVALAPELDPDRGTGVAYVELDNPTGRIKPGMYAEVGIAAEVLEERLAVPRAAVLERDRRLLVFRAKDGRAEWTYVQTGAETDTGIEIVSGVAAGDTVLVDGHLTLAHGAPLRVRIAQPGS